jgi:molybdate transport system substrate-binding protein
MAEIKILSTLATKGALPDLLPRYPQSTGVTVAAEYGPTNALVPRIRAGEAADVAILTRAALDELAGEGVIVPESRTDVALSRVGIAVRAGAPKPDIGSAEALKATLLAARSIAYSRIGASGILFAGLIRRLGIADAVNAKATIATGLTGVLAAKGEVELAVQQVSELMQVSGIDIVGPLPAEVEPGTMLAAGVLARSTERETAARLIAYLASAEAARAFVAAGLEPPQVRT